MPKPATYPGSAPAPTLNDLPKRQNDPDMLKLLRAKSAAYDWAQWLYRLQFVTLVLLPVALGVLQRLRPEASWIAGAIGLLLVVTDWYPVEPAQKRWKALGALFQERFDCTLFHLPWRTDRNGPPPSAEECHRWSARHRSVEGLQDWYSPLVESLPLVAATVVCQRTNGYWNWTMRDRYAVTIQAVVAALIVAVIGMTLSVGISERTIFAAVGLSLPLFRWVFKEMTQHREASVASRRVVERADRLWRKLLEGGESTSDSLQQDIRELQTDILDQRRRDPMVFGWVYSLWRTTDEETMHVGTEELVTEYNRAQAR